MLPRLFVQICFLFILSRVDASEEAKDDKIETVDCNTLRLGQYICPDPTIDQIDPSTQQFRGCVKGKDIPSEGEAEVKCVAAEGIHCEGTNNSTFTKKLPCKWTNGYSLEIALLLSVFLGMFGLDRFYLGYPGIGLAKLCTLGFMFLGQLLDIILIAAQAKLSAKQYEDWNWRSFTALGSPFVAIRFTGDGWWVLQMAQLMSYHIMELV